MNIAGLKGAIARNKTPLGVGGAALVAVLAWRARASKTTTPASTPASANRAPGVTASPMPGYGGGYTTGTGPYDSSSSDIYNALQPQIETTQGLLNKLLANQNPTSPIPVPAPPAPPAAPLSDDDQRKGLITGWYQQYLGRAATPYEQTWLSGEVAKGTVDMSRARINIQNSAEARDHGTAASVG
jgi:hypothetical protein